MRILKKILLTFFALVFLICIVGYFYYKHKITPAPNELSTKQIFINTPFKWEAIPTNKGLDSNGAMFVPVYLRGCPKRFYMQFDLGHPTSCFYKCTLDKINSKYHNISFQQNSEQVHLSNFDFYIDKFLINAKMISALNCTVSDFNWDDSTSIITIGTLGSDIIENKILVIDYPQTNIYIGNEIPQDIASLVFFSDFKFKYRRILLPSVVGKKMKLFFSIPAQVPLN